MDRRRLAITLDPVRAVGEAIEKKAETAIIHRGGRPRSQGKPVLFLTAGPVFGRGGALLGLCILVAEQERYQVTIARAFYARTLALRTVGQAKVALEEAVSNILALLTLVYSL
jgi:hypothetical protein